MRTVLQSIERITNRRMSKEAELKHSYPWEWDRTRYPDNYLVQRVTEKQVQDGIIATLEFYRIDAIAIDAGMQRARGKIIQLAKQLGVNLAAEIANFKGGGLPAGFSDLHGTLAPDGVSLYIEVKAPAWIDPDNSSKIISDAGRPTREQLVFLDAKHQRGAVCLVAWSVDDVMRALGERADRNRAALDR